MPTIRVTGTPANPSQRATTLPGDFGSEQIRARQEQEAQQQATYGPLLAPESASVNAHLAANLQSNRQYTSAGTGSLNLPNVSGRNLPPPATGTGAGAGMGMGVASNTSLAYLREIATQARATNTIALREEAYRERQAGLPTSGAQDASPAWAQAYMAWAQQNMQGGRPGTSWTSGMRGDMAGTVRENRDQDTSSAQARRETGFETRNRDLSAVKERREEADIQRETGFETRNRNLSAVKEQRETADLRRETTNETRSRDLSAAKSQREAAELRREADQQRAATAIRLTQPFGAFGALTGPGAGDRWGGPGGGGRGNGGGGPGGPGGRPGGGGGGPEGPGGGGGGGGGGGSGDWGGRGVGRSIGGAFGFGNTMEAGAGVLAGSTVSMGLVAEVAKEVLTAPLIIGKLQSAWLGEADQALRYRANANQMGQQGGFSGRALMDMMLDKGEDVRAQTGVGRDEMLAMVRAIGIAPRSAEEAFSRGDILARQRITPGLSAIPESMRLGMLGNMMALGVGSGTELTAGGVTRRTSALPQISESMRDIMLRTADTGQASLRVLQSIDTGVSSLSMLPTAGTALNPSALFNLNQRFMPLPEAMTGQAGTRAIAGTAGRYGEFGRNSTMSVLGGQLAQRLRTPEALAGFFSKTPEDAAQWQAFAASGPGKMMLSKYFESIQQGDTLGAAAILTQGILQDPNIAGTSAAQDYLMNNPLTAGLSPGMKLWSQTNLSGKSMAEVGAWQATGGQEAGRSAVLKAVKGTPSVSQALALSLAGVESNFNPGARSSKGAMGLMQLMPGTAAEMGLKGNEVWDPLKNAAAGLGYFQKLLLHFGGNEKMALEAYNWGLSHEADIRAGHVPSDVSNYAGTVMAREQALNKADPRYAADARNVEQYNQSISIAKSGVLMGSEFALVGGGTVVWAWGKVMTMADELGNAIKEAAQASANAASPSQPAAPR